MTKKEIERGIAVLKQMRNEVLSCGYSVYVAWPVREMAARQLLLRHVRRGVAPFTNDPALWMADDLPTAHALAWIDTAIAYAEKHGR